MSIFTGTITRGRSLEDMSPEERAATLLEIEDHEKQYAEQRAREAACCVHRGVSYNDLSDAGCPACGCP